MTQEDLDVLAGFGAVWERVSGQPMESAPASSVTWEALLGELHEYWQGCRGLSIRAVGLPKRRLMGLAAEAKEAFRMVQTECFLETGDIFAGEVRCDFASYTPYNLRKLYKNAVKLAELLQKAAEEGCLPVEDARKRITDHETALKGLLRECLQ